MRDLIAFLHNLACLVLRNPRRLMPALMSMAAALLCSEVSAAMTHEQCLRSGRCVEFVPARTHAQYSTDEHGYRYSLCSLTYGRNFPCSRFFNISVGDDEAAAVDSGIQYHQERIDPQSACACRDGATPIAGIAQQTPWASAHSPQFDLCTYPLERAAPRSYKSLFELQGHRFYVFTEQCSDEQRVVGSATLRRSREKRCPAGSTQTRLAADTVGCVRNEFDPLKSLGASCARSPKVGNPIDVASGNKYQRETDYLGTGRTRLRFERHYNSHPGALPASLGRQWRHTYERELRISEVAAMHIRPDGRVVYFSRPAQATGEAWQALDADVLERLRDAEPGISVGGVDIVYQVHTDDDQVESYDANGRLMAITWRGGLRTTLDYDAEQRLMAVHDPFQRSLRLDYRNDGRLREMRDPAGQRYSFDYDHNGMLARVRYPAVQGVRAERRYLYDDAEHAVGLSGIVDERGILQARWDYDAEARAVLSEHASGAGRTRLSAMDNAEVVVTDALGARTHFGFELTQHSYRVTTLSSPCDSCGGASAHTQYSPSGFPTSRTDFNGVRTHYQHNPRGLQTLRIEGVGTEEARTVRTTWHALMRLPLSIEKPGQRIDFSYTDAAMLHTRTLTDTLNGRARITTWSYTDGRTPGVPAGLIESIDGPRVDVDDVTRFDYHRDGSGNLFTLTNALGHTLTYTDYDAHGRALRWRDANGLVTQARYDQRGRVLQLDSDSRSTHFVYDAAGRLTQATTAQGQRLRYGYDVANRLLSIEDIDGNRIRFDLNAAGYRTATHILDPQGNLVRTQRALFDPLGRLREHATGDSSPQRYDYDAQGNLERHEDGLGVSSVYHYDALNRIRQSTTGEQALTRYDYDARDNLIGVTDARGLHTRYVYSGLDERTETHSPDTGATVFTHDEAGNVLSRLDARAIRVRYRYDALNRLIAREYPEPENNVYFDYDQGRHGIGQLTRMQDASGLTRFEYDLRGQLRAEHRDLQGTLYSLRYDYDDDGQRQRITYPSGRVLHFSRDRLGRISEVALDDNATRQVLAHSITYQPFGERRHLVRGNDLSEQRHFDLASRITQLHSLPGVARRYDYDANDNITSIVELNDSSRDQYFGYDASNRLSTAQGIYGSLAFEYDALGNRLTRSDARGQDRYHYEPDSNRLTRIDGPGADSFDYDPLGNTIARGAQTLHYNDAGRLQQILTPSATTHFDYNGFGERVMRETNAQRTAYVFDHQGTLMAQTDAQGIVQREYVYLHGAPFAVIDTPPKRDAQVLLTQNGTAIQPPLRLSINITQASLSITEGTLATRFNTQPVRFTEPEHGVASVWATLEGEGWLYIRFPAPGIAASPDNTSVLIYDPHSSSRAHYSGSADGTQPQLPVSERIAGQTATLHIDTQAKQLTLGHPDGRAQSIDLRSANWGRFDSAVPGAQHHIVTEYTLDRQLSLWFVKDDSAPHPRAATLSLVEGYPIYRRYAALSLTTQHASSPDTPEVYWTHNDHLGTPQALTDAQGIVRWQADYLPFGGLIERVTDIEQNLRFPGQYAEDAIVGSYNYHRYYDPGTGRYLRSDPIGLEGGINTYAYADGDPIAESDPYGLSPTAVIGLGVRVIGGGAATAAVGRPIARAIGGRLGRWAACAAVFYCDEIASDEDDDVGNSEDAEGICEGGHPDEEEQPPSRRSHFKKAKLPTTGKIRYIPPKKWRPTQPLPRGPQRGYVDKFGNEWTKGPSRTRGQPFEWDVQRPNGSHWNISLDGKVTH